MTIIIAVLSIFALTGVVWLANRFLGFRVCPICAGVSLTWAWLLTGYLLDFIVDPVLIAALMGGSVVGIAYQLEKRPSFAKASEGKALLWKTLFMPAGFALVYFVLTRSWLPAMGATIVLAAIAVAFLTKRATTSKTEPSAVAELEEKMKKCC
jgi:hypothetical protein